MNLTPAELELLELAKKTSLVFYKPYPKQREFHDQGATKRERALIAANKVGKTYSAAAEAAIHTTGLYPEDWKGRRFKGATKGWASGLTNSTTRDTVQEMLLGEFEPYGTGAIPADLIVDVNKARTISGAVDRVVVKHISGESSSIYFKSYEQGREAWQGPNIDWVWFDEEPPREIYSEGLMRTAANGGIAWLTFTPLLGTTTVVDQFYPVPDSPHRGVVSMTFDDAPHFADNPALKEAVLAGCTEYDIDARSKGIPMMGEGRVFTVPEEHILCEPFRIPRHWAQLGGLDFGWTHPTAGAFCAWDRDADTFYVTDEYRLSKETPVVHAHALQRRGSWMPWAWPHDGMIHDKQSGISIAEAYRRLGVKLLPQHSTFIDGGYGVEAGCMEMLDAMKTGRFKVFSTCTQWLEEFRTYHRKDGKIVKEKDDLLAATRYAWMSKRFARVNDHKPLPQIIDADYDPLQPGGMWN